MMVQEGDAGCNQTPPKCTDDHRGKDNLSAIVIASDVVARGSR